MNPNGSIFVLRDRSSPTGEVWGVEWRGEIVPAEWPDKGPAQAHLDGLRRAAGIEPPPMVDCDFCGEPCEPEWYLGSRLCGECLPSEEYRFTDCSLCDRPIDHAKQRTPLCDYCASVCQAHARLERDRQEQAADFPPWDPNGRGD